MLLCPDGELRVLAQCTFASVYICRNPLAQTAYSSFMHAHDDDDDDDDDADADDDDDDDDDVIDDADTADTADDADTPRCPFGISF